MALSLGVGFIVCVLVLAIFFPDPTPFQYTVFRIVLALAAGEFTAILPGFIHVNLSKVIRAGGVFGVFVIIYFYTPTSLFLEVPGVSINQ